MLVFNKQGAADLWFNASSICPDKIFFVQDNIQIVQDKSFVEGWKVYSLLSKAMHNEYF